jgi:histidine triad (HIT) family protein
MIPMNYDSNNVFAKILREEIPCHRIYEDEQSLAFMDVMPQVEGHCLVIPKQKCRNLLDVEGEVLSHLMSTVQRVAQAALKAMNADGVQIRQYNETAAGQTVFHLHFHILPLKEGDAVRPHNGTSASHETLAQQAELIRAALKD